MTTLTVARRNVKSAAAESRRKAVAAEVARLDRVASEKRTSAQAEDRGRRADAAEAQVRAEAPVLTIKYRGRTITVRISHPDSTVRQSGLYAATVVARYLALDLEARARRARGAAIGAALDPETPIDSLMRFMTEGELSYAAAHDLIAVEKAR